jgi:hypothetical protein
MTKTLIAMLLTTGFSAFAQGSTTAAAALPTLSDADAYLAQIEKVYQAAMDADPVRPAVVPITSCACPVLKPAAKRVVRPTPPPPAAVPQIRTAGLIALPSLPEWVLWLAAFLFGGILLAIAFLFGRVTAPLPPPHAPIVIHVPAAPAPLAAAAVTAP